MFWLLLIIAFFRGESSIFLYIYVYVCAYTIYTHTHNNNFLYDFVDFLSAREINT